MEFIKWNFLVRKKREQRRRLVHHLHFHYERNYLLFGGGSMLLRELFTCTTNSHWSVFICRNLKKVFDEICTEVELISRKLISNLG